MISRVVYITKNILYAIKLGKDNEYWKVAWDSSNLAATIRDVTTTLGSSSFHLVLGVDLPSLLSPTSAPYQNVLEEDDPSSAYQQFFIEQGVVIESINTSPKLLLKYILSQGVSNADIYLSKYEQCFIQIRAGKIEEATLTMSAPTLGGLWLYVDGASIGDHSRPLPNLPELAVGQLHEEVKVGSLEDFDPSKKRFNWIIPSMILITLLLAAGVWFLWGQTLLQNTTPQSTTHTISPTIAPTPIVTPTPSPIIPSPNNGEFSVQIQNGSGVAGLAGKVSAKLEGEGFVVKDVGNADNFNYKQGVIKSLSTVPASVITSITELFGTSNWDKELLPSGGRYDIVIIIGKDTSISN